MNLYAYVNNRPTFYVDPTGLALGTIASKIATYLGNFGCGYITAEPWCSMCCAAMATSAVLAAGAALVAEIAICEGASLGSATPLCIAAVMADFTYTQHLITGEVAQCKANCDNNC